MTCTTCASADFAAPAPAPGLLGRLLAALAPFPAISRLDVESLSAHQLRDLGLADGRAAAPRDRMLD